MTLGLRLNETILKEGAANLQKGIEAVGGRLALTNQRLIFSSHSMNVQGGVTALELSEIRSCHPCWTKFLNLIPLLPNSLAVVAKSGKEYRFVLFERTAWAAAIDARTAG